MPKINEQDTEDKCCTSKNSNGNSRVKDKIKYRIDYFGPGPKSEVDMKGSAVITKSMHSKFKDMLIGIGHFKGTFLLQVKDWAKPYQMPLWCTAYTLQHPFKDEFDQL